MTNLWHHVYDVDRLREAYFALNRKGAAGIDGETWQRYGEDLEANLQSLSERLREGSYRAQSRESGTTSRKRTADSGPSAYRSWKTRSRRGPRWKS